MENKEDILLDDYVEEVPTEKTLLEKLQGGAKYFVPSTAFTGVIATLFNLSDDKAILWVIIIGNLINAIAIAITHIYKNKDV